MEFHVLDDQLRACARRRGYVQGARARQRARCTVGVDGYSRRSHRQSSDILPVVRAEAAHAFDPSRLRSLLSLGIRLRMLRYSMG
jgi:hypothetical protein